MDAAAHRVTLGDGTEVAGSQLVLAAGAQPEFFGVPGAAEHAFPLYSVVDAERLRRHLRDLVREHAHEPGAQDAPEPPPGALDVVVVGGGPTGVETAGAVAELMAALTHTGRLAAPARVVLVDRGTALLAPFTEAAHHDAHGHLTSIGVEVRLGTGVAAVHADRVELDDGTAIPTRTVVWGGGESAAPAPSEPAPSGSALALTAGSSVVGLPAGVAEPPAGAVAGASRTSDPGLVYVITFGSSTCPMVADPEALATGATAVEITFPEPAGGACAADYVPATSVVALPDVGSGDLQVLLGPAGDVTLPAGSDAVQRVIDQG